MLNVCSKCHPEITFDGWLAECPLCRILAELESAKKDITTQRNLLLDRDDEIRRQDHELTDLRKQLKRCR